jgi:type 2 lantibiotic biosynthesis protein LanM
LTLEERVKLLGQLPSVFGVYSGTNLINPFEGLAQISPESLHAYGVSDPAALQAIRVPVDLLAELLFPSKWLDDFSAQYRDAAKTVQFAPSGLGLCDAFWPLINSASAAVQRFMEQCSNGSFDLCIDVEPVLQTGQAYLYERLFSPSARTLVVELGAAHALGLLQGRTSRQRFAFFVECLREPSFASKILAQYPVLMRQAVGLVEDWRDAIIEFLGRLARDWKEISADFFAGRECGPLRAVEMSAGDSHSRGRSTIIAAFTNAEKLVYKPRSLRVDVHFAQLVDWLNRRSPDFQIGACTVIAKESYGWSKFIAHHACTSLKRVRLFYRRQGANLALLYLLGGNDAHSENLIAQGDTPKLVDLETLFHPQLASQNRGAAEMSVLATGLLPRQRTNELDQWVDLSALGNAGGEEFPLDLPAWENLDSDQIRIVHARQKITANQNLPLLRGRRVRSSSFADEVIDGFAAMYDLFCKHRTGLLAADGPIAAFKGDMTRVVVRSTVQYALLLEESYHPKYLSNALEREAAFDDLWRTISDRELLAQLIAAERCDLWRGDIPTFYARTDTVDLWTSSGEQIVQAFKRSGLDAALSRVAALEEKDLERQTQAIRSVMGQASPARSSRRSAEIVIREEFRQRAVGAKDAEFLKDTLSRYLSGVRSSSFAQLEATKAPPHASLAMGGAGIAYALWKASRHLNDESLLAHAERWIFDSLAAVGKADAFTGPEFGLTGTRISGGSVLYGIAGLHYVRALVAGAMHDITAKEQAIRDFRTLVETVRPVSLDLTSGAPGQLLAIAHLKTELGCGSLDETGHRLYERVLATPRRPLRHLGTAHGLGGLYISLLKWSELSNVRPPQWFWPSVDRLAAKGEWSGQSVQWPIEWGAATRSYMNSWCNGAPGLMFLWIRAYKATGNERFLKLARGCGHAILSEPQSSSHLCCGTAGQAYSLLALSTSEADWKDSAFRLARKSMKEERFEIWNHSLLKGQAGLLCLALDLLACRPDLPCIGAS